MKTLRTIGSVVNTLLSLVLVVVLLAASFAYSTASLVSADTVRSITREILMDDAIQTKISEMVAQSAVMDYLPETEIKDILNMPQIQDTVADILADAVSDPSSIDTMEPSKKFVEMVEKDEEVFAEFFDERMQNNNVIYEDVYDTANDYARDNQIAEFEYGMSVTDICKYLLENNSEMVDTQMRDAIKNILAEEEAKETGSGAKTEHIKMIFLGSGDGTAMALGSASVKGVRGISSMALLDGNVVGTVLSVAEMVRGATFIIGIIVLLIILYLLMSLLTWSLRIPTLFFGISMVVAGLLVLCSSAVPISEIAASAVKNVENADIINTVISSFWNAMKGSLSTWGIAMAALGAVLTAVFFVTGIFKKKGDDDDNDDADIDQPFMNETFDFTQM